MSVPCVTVRNSLLRGCQCGVLRPHGFTKPTAWLRPVDPRAGKLATVERTMEPPVGAVTAAR